MGKICHFTSSHRPDDSRIAHKEVKALQERFNDVSLVTHRYSSDFAKISGVNYLQTNIEVPKSRLKRLTIGAWKVYRLAASVKADIYHFHDPELLPYSILLRLKNKKVIYDVHEDLVKDISSKSWLPNSVKVVIGSLVNFIEKNIARCASAVITPCEPITEKFLQFNKKAITINNYPEQTTFYPLNIPKKRQVCYLGTITHTRGIQQAIEACYHAGVKLVLGGDFRDQALYEACQAMPEWENVEWVGYLPHEEVNKVMNESLAGLLLLTYSQYYQPIKLFEYMSAGIPVIASDFAKWIELIDNNHIGYCVAPNDIAAITQKIKTCSDNEQETIDMGQRARMFVETHYSWEQESKKLLTVYDKL